MIEANPKFMAIIEELMGYPYTELKKVDYLKVESFPKNNISFPFNSSGELDLVYKKHAVYEDIDTNIKILKVTCGHLEDIYVMKNDYEKFIAAHSGIKYKVNIPKKYIDYIKNFLEESRYKDYNIFLNKGLILSGPPGNGKTKILEYIYNNYNSVYVTNVELIEGRYYGARPRFCDTDKKNLQYNIELYDDIDMKIFEEGSIYYNNILPKFDDGKNLTTRIFATNQSIENISKAFLRPGRISNVLEIKNPDREEREILFKDFPVDLTEETDGLSYAEIQHVKMCLIECDFNIDEGLKRAKKELVLK